MLCRSCWPLIDSLNMVGFRRTIDQLNKGDLRFENLNDSTCYMQGTQINSKHGLIYCLFFTIKHQYSTSFVFFFFFILYNLTKSRCCGKGRNMHRQNGSQLRTALNYREKRKKIASVTCFVRELGLIIYTTSI